MRQQLRNKRKLNDTFRETLGLEIGKQAIGISSGMWKVRKWTLRNGGPPPVETEKATVDGVRVGNGGASATLGSFPTPIGKSRVIVKNLDWNPIREPLGWRGLKKGAEGAVGE
jgi:hypothetical protein